MNKVTILCMKWGQKYDASYVNKLFNMTKRHLSLPFDFVCLTDDPTDIDNQIKIYPIPRFSDRFYEKSYRRDGGWKKLLTFSSPLYDLTGTALFLDLDIVIVDSLDAFFTQPGEFLIIKDWLKPDLTGNSSVYRFEIGKWSKIISHFEENEDRIRKTFRNEQEYLTHFMKEQGVLQYWDDSLIKSFKRHCMQKGLKAWLYEPKLPEQAKIIVFHGNPNPPDAIVGKSGKWFRKILPTAWVAQHWQ